MAYWSPADLWFEKYKARRNDYFKRNFSTVRIELNPHDPEHCPHCNTNHDGWHIRDFDDLVCLCCGWRESFYFDKPRYEFIKKRVKVEKKLGTDIPAPFTDIDLQYGVVNYREFNDRPLRESLRHQEYRKTNKEKRAENSKRWRLEHPEKNKEYKARQRLLKPELVKEADRRWRMNNKEQVKALNHTYYLRKKQRQKELELVKV